MKHKNTTVTTFNQTLLWFGAAVSIAEILTGALLAPLGMGQGFTAIIIGHLIGAIILFCAGFIGAKTGLSSAETIQISFGKYGSSGFSLLNLLQLLGWTAIMIISAAKAFDGLTGQLWQYQNEKLWCLAIGLFIILWVVVGIKNLAKVNSVVMFALLVSSLILGYIVFQQTNTPIPAETTLEFGAAVELNVAMSLSWLPLIADYTRQLKNPLAGTVGSVLGYCFGSVLMFTIGLGAALFAGTADVSSILLAAGLGLVALVIVILSTVTTTFLDVYSAGVSIKNLNQKVNEKIASIVVCMAGTLLAMFVPMSQYENFLYLIGSVFAPLFAILFVDYFLLKKQDFSPNMLLNPKNALLWCAGFIAYRFLLPYNTLIGITLPVMAAIGILSFLIHKGGHLIHEKP